MNQRHSIKLIYIPCKNKAEAKSIGKKSIKAALAACANIFPIDSIYLWQNQLKEDKETILLLKTTVKKTKSLVSFVNKNHSYDIAAIISIDAEVSHEYYTWMKTTLQKNAL